jgi:phosphoadenosine phosphosulfate reductase
MTGRKLKITPPGDIRPIFESDLKRIFSAIESQFGVISANKFQDMVEGHILLLNKVPYIDRMDEIYFLGENIGLLRFNPVREGFEFVPKLPLARKLWHPNAKGWVDVDIGAKEPILKGASVLVPGVLGVYGEIIIDDPTIIVCQNEVIAVGLAKMDHDTMLRSSYGVAVKTKYRKGHEIQIIDNGATWEDIIQANDQSLSFIETEAIKFIEKAARDFNQVVVAYSGGKDSLVTLDLVARSDVPYEIIFANTGLEFPETLENVNLISQTYSRNILTSNNQIFDFWERFDSFGPPTRNSRWCCKSSKLAPINSILELSFPDDDQILTFIGKRRYESLGRSQEPRISKNPWIPKQISASPINNWSAFEVYLYIKAKDLSKQLNPLYDKGYIRIGCWVCPASSLADFSIMQDTHPSLIQQLTEKLSQIKEKWKYPNQYITWGLWRWKILPSKVLNLLKTNDITFKSHIDHLENTLKLLFNITSSPSSCIQGGFSSYLLANQMLDLEKIERLLPILGEIDFNTELDILSCSDRDGVRTDVFRDGSIIIRDNQIDSVLPKAFNFIKTIFRVIYCDGCGVCTFNCRDNALFLDQERIKVDSSKCTQCLRCNDFCPLLRYRKDESFISKETQTV